MPPKEKPQPYINTHIIPTPGHPIVRKTTPITNGPITIITPNNLPNTKPITQPQHIIIPTSQPLSNHDNLILSNLPNTTTDETKQDNTLSYVLIGAVIVGFIILSNKDI